MDLQNPSSYLATLDVNTVALASAGLALLYFITSTAWNAYRLSHIPGPFMASFTSLMAFYYMKSLRFHEFCSNLQKYGKLVRITPNELMVSDPDTLWRINSARSAYGRSDWYSSMRINPYGHSLLTEMDTVRHDKRKAKLIYGYSGKGLMNLESNVDTQMAILMDVLKQKTSRGKAVVDIGRILQYFQVDLISFVGMGGAWGDLTQEKDNFDYLGDNDSMVPWVHSISMLPLARVVCYSSLFLRLFGPSSTEGWLGELGRTVQKRVQGAKAVIRNSGDMLDEWLKNGISPEEAEMDLSLQMPAGTETSITTIRVTLKHLMSNPRVYRKLKEEIAEAIRNGQISSPVRGEEAKSLPYLQAVINEGLRINPPVTGGFAKKVPPGGDVICGKPIPAGVAIHINLIGMTQDEDVFGQDVKDFRPERFLDCDDDTRARRLKVVDLIFGHGRWLCLGKVLAWMEMSKLFVELFRNFDFDLPNSEKPWTAGATLSWFIRDFNAQVTHSPIV